MGCCGKGLLRGSGTARLSVCRCSRPRAAGRADGIPLPGPMSGPLTDTHVGVSLEIAQRPPGGIDIFVFRPAAQSVTHTQHYPKVTKNTQTHTTQLT